MVCGHYLSIGFNTDVRGKFRGSREGAGIDARRVRQEEWFIFGEKDGALEGWMGVANRRQ